MKKVGVSKRGFFDQKNCIEKSTWKKVGFFDHRNFVEKSMWKQRGFLDQRNYTEKSTWKQREFFDHRNYVEKSMWKRRGFLDQRNYIEKVRGNDVEMRRIWSSTYPRNIHIESTSIRRGVPAGELSIVIYSNHHLSFAADYFLPRIMDRI